MRVGTSVRAALGLARVDQRVLTSEEDLQSFTSESYPLETWPLRVVNITCVLS